MSKQLVTNPYTGRKIMVGGATHRKISRTLGWKVDAPKKGSERHMLKQQCGNQCFLKPETEGFPICAKCVNDKCSCKIDCRGLASAKVRAHQYHHEELYDAIDRLQQQHCNYPRA